MPLLETDMKERAKVWLAGISRDIGRCNKALGEVNQCWDACIGKSYESKFKHWNQELVRHRQYLESGTHLQKQELVTAENDVVSFKTDLVAWNNISVIYMKKS